jgi:hypothetical protein
MPERMNPEDIVLVVTSRIAEIASAGAPVAVDPDDAEEMGAFADNALDLDDAMESRFDDVVEGA